MQNLKKKLEIEVKKQSSVGEVYYGGEGTNWNVVPSKKKKKKKKEKEKEELWIMDHGNSTKFWALIITPHKCRSVRYCESPFPCST